MVSKMNDAYVEKNSAEDHLRFIGSDEIIIVDMVNSNGKVDCTVQQSRSQYGGIRSAINNVHILARVKMPGIMKR